MKINRYFKPLTYAALSMAVSSIAFSAAFASQYNNSYREDTAYGSQTVKVEYSGLSHTMGFFDEAQGSSPSLAGQADTRLQVRQRNLKPIDYTKRTTGKTYRDGSIFGGTCCEASASEDNSIFPGQGCGTPANKCDKDSCKQTVAVKAAPCTRAGNCPAKRQVMATEVETPDTIRYNFVRNYIQRPRRDVYASIHQKCGKYAPIQLEWVEFRLNEEDINGSMAQKLGNYRFRIFGCRRFTKEAVLNQGRLMERNFRLISAFDNELKDCFNIVKIPNDLCTEVTPSPLPEYLITAEITNYFMNICDKYNWDDSVRADKRIGSSEITVRWTVTDINKTKVYWSGETDGYGELNRGEPNGEVILVEKAFADAANNLRNNPYFLRQVSRRFSPAEKESQRIQRIETEKALNPVKCQYTQHDTEANQVSKYVYTPENRKPAETTITTTTTTTIEHKPSVIERQPEAIVEQRVPTPTVIARMPGGAVVEKRSDGTIEPITPPAPAPLPAPLSAPMPAPAPVPEPQPTPEPLPAVSTTTTTTTTTTITEPPSETVVINNLSVEETQPAPADILLSKEAAPEPFDPSMSVKSAEDKYGQIEESAEIKVNLTETTPETPSGVVPGIGLPVTPPQPCNNMTLFGPDCDCNNKIYGGCEDNKFYGGCEDNKLTDQCDACDSIFACCGKDKKVCPIPADAEEKGGVTGTGSISKESWINVPTDDKGAIEAQNMLCIVDREAYAVPLSADDIYKIRTSIVSISNHNGKQGAGLLVDERFVLTSADLITKDINSYNLRTINGGAFTGKAVRINPEKNTALLYLDKSLEYTPLSLNLELPPINSDTYLSLGILDFDTGEGYLEDSGKVSGYRYSESRGTEIIVDSYVQDTTLGGALIDKKGTITGFAHAGKNGTGNTDLYLPIATALKSVGLEICGKRITDIPVRNTEISNAILFNSGSKEPLPMDKAERK